MLGKIENVRGQDILLNFAAGIAVVCIQIGLYAGRHAPGDIIDFKEINQPGVKYLGNRGQVRSMLYELAKFFLVQSGEKLIEAEGIHIQEGYLSDRKRSRF
ncbi:MAG: hypothetical protein V3V57_15555 [Spirochaetia bacterium]